MTKLQQVVQSLLEREFNTKETMQVLSCNQPVFLSWGVSKILNIQDKGLLLKVNGHHHKDYVLIALAWDDTYSVYILNKKGEILDTYKDVYFDILTETIDNRIERIDVYKK